MLTLFAWRNDSLYSVYIKWKDEGGGYYDMLKVQTKIFKNSLFSKHINTTSPQERRGRPTTTIFRPSHIFLIILSEPHFRKLFRVHRILIYFVNYSENHRIFKGGSMGKMIGRCMPNILLSFLYIAKLGPITEAEEI